MFLRLTVRFCPTFNNNTTNIYKTELTMMEDAPYASDHDDDGKRRASSYSYDLPNQELNQDDNNDNISFIPPSLLNAINELTVNKAH